MSDNSQNFQKPQKKILIQDNSTPYIFIQLEEYDPERHLLPVCYSPIPAGALVGLFPSGDNLPEHASDIADEPDFWVFHRFGMVRQNYGVLEPMQVFAAREDSVSGAEQMIMVKLKLGLYLDRAGVAQEILRTIDKIYVSHLEPKIVLDIYA